MTAGFSRVIISELGKLSLIYLPIGAGGFKMPAGNEHKSEKAKQVLQHWSLTVHGTSEWRRNEFAS